jgi:hypothetical protein
LPLLPRAADTWQALLTDLEPARGVFARLLREGFWKEAGWVSPSIESDANVDCSELTVPQPWLSEYVDSVRGVIGVIVVLTRIRSATADGSELC